MINARQKKHVRDVNKRTSKRSHKEKKHALRFFEFFCTWGFFKGVHTSFFSTSNIGIKCYSKLDWRWDPTDVFFRTPRKSLVREAGRGTKRLLTTPRCSAWIGRSFCFFRVAWITGLLTQGWGILTHNEWWDLLGFVLKQSWGIMSYIMVYPPVEQPTRKSWLFFLHRTWNSLNYGWGGSPQIGNCFWL